MLYAVLILTPKASGWLVQSGMDSRVMADATVADLYSNPFWSVGTRWEICEEVERNRYRSLATGTK